MPSTSHNKNIQSKVNQKKNRLGRGLGSLLTTHPDEFDKQGTSVFTDKLKVEAKEPKPTQSGSSEAPLTPQAPMSAGKESDSVQEKDIENRDLSESNRVWSMAIEKVFPNKSQPRKDFNKEPLEELAQSIRTQGIIQPITVRKKDGGFEIIAGERRWRAAQIAGLQEVPVIIKNVSDQKVMELALIENLQREDLNPLEEAMGFQQLLEEYELTQADLAQKVGKSRSSITNSLRILSLPVDVRQMLREGALSIGHAKVLLSIQDPEQQKALAKKSSARQWSVRALEREIKSGVGAVPENSERQDAREKLAIQLVEQVQRAIATKVGLRYKKGKGRIEIHFYSDEELSSHCERLKESLSSL